MKAPSWLYREGCHHTGWDLLCTAAPDLLEYHLKELLYKMLMARIFKHMLLLQKGDWKLKSSQWSTEVFLVVTAVDNNKGTLVSIWEFHALSKREIKAGGIFDFLACSSLVRVFIYPVYVTGWANSVSYRSVTRRDCWTSQSAGSYYSYGLEWKW